LRSDEQVSGRLAGWLTLVGVLAALNYADRFANGKPPKDVLYQYSTAIGSVVLFGIILAIVLVIARGDTELLALRAPRSWLGSLGMAALVLVGIYMLGAIVSPFLHPGQEQGLTPDKWDPSRAGAFFANAAVICVLAPITEELTFRGLGFALLRRFGDDWAVWGTALLFGLAHGLVEALPLLVAFGAGLAWIRLRQDSVLPGMVVHGSFNAIALAVAVWA
jgi:membrane protease YdiL (CAAX protease family)